VALPIPDKQQALDQGGDAAGRFIAQLRSIDDPNPTAIGYWTIGDVAAHVSHVLGIYPDLLDGGVSPIADHLNLDWDSWLAKDPERDPKALADRIESSLADFLGRADKSEWTEVINWHGGLRLPVYSVFGMVVNEWEVHGRDIALAAGRSWTIPRENAVLSIESLMPVLPHYLNEDTARDLDAVFGLHLRSGSTSYATVAGGSLGMSSTRPDRVDCHLSVDPVEYVLVGFGRKGQWGPVLTGKIVAWGRKPWLSLRFGRLFRSI
jgi:uncharacterized protein (TIGR03083 family)